MFKQSMSGRDLGSLRASMSPSHQGWGGTGPDLGGDDFTLSDHHGANVPQDMISRSMNRIGKQGHIIKAGPRKRDLPGQPKTSRPSSAPHIAAVGLDRVLRQINWGANPQALRAGDLSSLPRSVADMIRAAAAMPSIVAAAKKAKLEPIAFVLALVARAETNDRSADRLARTVFGKTPKADLDAAARGVGL
jgi:hypothetical protein